MCTCTEKYLPELLRLLHCVRAKWESIATQLGLSQGDIEAIGRKKFHNPDDCLKEVITLWLRGLDPVPTREQLARALQSPPVGREDIAQQVVPGLSKLPPKLSEVGPVQLGRRPLQSPPVGREDIAHVQQVVPGLPNFTKSLQKHCNSVTMVLALVIILGIVTWYGDLSQHKSLPKPVFRQELIEKKDHDKDISPPGKSLSLPVLKQELIGREEEMKVIMGYFIESEVDVVTLYGQAGFGKSEIALHVGHRMLQLGLDVHYIRVEDFKNVSSLEEELMEISGTSYTSKRLVKWAKGLTKKTLLILDNVEGEYWVGESLRQHFQLDFLYHLLEHSSHLQVLITSQQKIMSKYVFHSLHLYSLSTNDCVHLMESRGVKIDTADSEFICKSVGNVPLAISVLTKTLLTYSVFSVQIIKEKLTESSSKLAFMADRANSVDKDRLLSAIELAFQFVRQECQTSTFILVKFWQPFTLDMASNQVTSEMMRNLNYTDFDIII